MKFSFSVRSDSNGRKTSEIILKCFYDFSSNRRTATEWNESQMQFNSAEDDAQGFLSWLISLVCTSNKSFSNSSQLITENKITVECLLLFSK